MILGEDIGVLKEGLLEDKYTIKSNQNKLDKDLNKIETVIQSSTSNTKIDNFNNDGTIADMYSPHFPTSHYLTTLSTKTIS